MKHTRQQRAEELLLEALAGWLELTRSDLQVERDIHIAGRRVDYRVHTPRATFIVELKPSGSLPTIDLAVRRLEDISGALGSHTIPLVVVNYMTDAGGARCERADVSWVDLSGNAHISTPDLLIHVEGKPNQFKTRGRPSNLFASKSSRITRHLLSFPDRWFLQRELAEATGLTEGYTSRIVRRLTDEGLVLRESEGRANKITARDPELLLDTWRENYRFDQHVIQKGVVAARSGEELLCKVAGVLREQGVGHAATGLGAAWLWDGFASFRTASFYLKRPPTAELLGQLKFREETRGANLWLITPDDVGVFSGAEDIEGIHCVPPLQVYLDLKGHPERADEAAEHLRQRLLTWDDDG